MTIEEILQKAKDLGIHERRSASAEYCELVFFTRDLDSWQGILLNALGKPKKPPGREPTKSDLDLTQQTGGIRIDQTLYEKSFGAETIIAKFWPWEDGKHTTLKMAMLFTG